MLISPGVTDSPTRRLYRSTKAARALCMRHRRSDPLFFVYIRGWDLVMPLSIPSSFDPSTYEIWELLGGWIISNARRFNPQNLLGRDAATSIFTDSLNYEFPDHHPPPPRDQNSLCFWISRVVRLIDFSIAFRFLFWTLFPSRADLQW